MNRLMDFFMNVFPFVFIGIVLLACITFPILNYIEDKSYKECFVCQRPGERQNMYRIGGDVGKFSYICEDCLRNHLKEGNHHELGVQRIQPQD